VGKSRQQTRHAPTGRIDLGIAGALLVGGTAALSASAAGKAAA